MPASSSPRTSSKSASSKRSGSMLRIPEATHSKLKALADETGESMQDIVAHAVEHMRRQRILKQTNSAYAELRNNPAKWQAEVDEREAWDVALLEGIEEEN